MFKLSRKEPSIQQKLTWISTHPASEDRAKYIIEQSSFKKSQAIINTETWNRIKSELNKQSYY